MAYKVMVVDDQNISRKLFELIVENAEHFELLFSLQSALVAGIYCEKYPVDLIIMDIVMADGSNGLDEAERIKQRFPRIKIIVVTSMIETNNIRGAKQIGVDSFWYKEAADEDLLDVMECTMQGESVYPAKALTASVGLADSSEFTNAELAVLREITAGRSNSQIAEALGIEVGTVKTHIIKMLRKTGFQNRTELAVEARLKGIVAGRKRS